MNTFNQHNKSGDNYMNFGPQPRELNTQVETQLKQLIPANSKVSVTSVLGDGEAYNFASKIKIYLENQGYIVDGVNQALYSQTVKGQNIELPKDGDATYKLIIGSNL